ncbi:hypothetical protein, partial [Streptomyces hirsutus]|uniref:hypothetical protein n=1 Tax=Streptomyces hirsutus TaxID=35620 RepID=UPI0033284F97
WIMLDSPASTPQGRAEHGGARVVAAVLLLADTGIHAYEVIDMGIRGRRQVFAFTGTFCRNFTPRTATRHVTGPPACPKAPPAARQRSGNTGFTCCVNERHAVSAGEQAPAKSPGQRIGASSPLQEKSSD